MATSGLTNENEDLFILVGEMEGPLVSAKMFSTIGRHSSTGRTDIGMNTRSTFSPSNGERVNITRSRIMEEHHIHEAVIMDLIERKMPGALPIFL